MDTNVLQNSQALLATVLSFGGAYGTYAVKKIFDYFSTKTSVISDSEARDVANNALSTLDTLLETNITYAENVLKKPIIDSIADGKVTKDELKSLATLVKTNVLSQLTDSSKTALSQIATNVEDFVEKRLETVLGNLKVSDTSSVKTTEISMPTQQELDNTTLQNQLTQATTQNQTLTQQVTDIANAKATVDQSNTQLAQQISDLTNQLSQEQIKNQTIQAKLDSINSALSGVVQPVVSNSPVVAQAVDTIVSTNPTTITDAVVNQTV